jgi:phospholipid/cholesterol/gamma-HCH transport system substrate-binding protein
MFNERRIEFTVGLFFLIGIIAFLILAFKVSGLTELSDSRTYNITAKFINVGDLKIRAPVTVAGVTVGRVSTIILDQQTYKAIVLMKIENATKIPTDSTASIFTAGLIGSNYISISPGFEERFFKDGDEIMNTNQAMVLQNIIGQLIFNLSGKSKK